MLIQYCTKYCKCYSKHHKKICFNFIGFNIVLGYCATWNLIMIALARWSALPASQSLSTVPTMPVSDLK